MKTIHSSNHEDTLGERSRKPSLEQSQTPFTLATTTDEPDTHSRNASSRAKPPIGTVSITTLLNLPPRRLAHKASTSSLPRTTRFSTTPFTCPTTSFTSPV